MKQHERICKLCGKVFYVDKLSRSQFCSNECREEHNKIRKHQYYVNRKNNFEKIDGETKENDIVKIKITKFIDVLDHLRPEVGDIYEAERVMQSNFSPIPLYIIRSIGKYGLIIRARECVEVV